MAAGACRLDVPTRASAAAKALQAFAVALPTEHLGNRAAEAARDSGGTADEKVRDMTLSVAEPVA